MLSRWFALTRGCVVHRFCYAADSTPGHFNFSLVIDTNERTDSRGYGRSIVSKSQYRVTADNTVYTTSVHAEVHSVSYSETGVLGGTPLVIKGTGFGFDPSAVSVDVAGVPCTIGDVSGTSITCTPAPVATSPDTFQPSNSSNRFPGGRGVLVERYDGPPCDHDCAVEWAQEYALTHEPDAVFLLDTELLTPTNVANHYVYRMTSFLVPRVSAPHSFWSRGDDYVLVQLSADETRDHLRTVSESRYYYNTFFSHSAQRGDPVDLVAGQRYLMEAWGYEGGGGDWHQVAVRVHEHAGFETTFNQRVRHSWACMHARMRRICAHTVCIRVRAPPPMLGVTVLFVGPRVAAVCAPCHCRTGGAGDHGHGGLGWPLPCRCGRRLREAERKDRL